MPNHEGQPDRIYEERRRRIGYDKEERKQQGRTEKGFNPAPMIEVRNRYLASYRRLISSRMPEIMITKSGVYGINDNSEARDHSEIGTVESGEKSLGVVASAPMESFPSASTPPSLPASTGSASTDPIAFKPTLSASLTASTRDTPGPLTSPEAPSVPTSTQLPSAVVPPASLPDMLSTLAKDTTPSQVLIEHIMEERYSTWSIVLCTIELPQWAQ